MKNKKAIAPIYIILAVLIVGAVILSSGINFNKLMSGDLTGSGSYIERPVFKYVKCEAIGDLKYSTPTNIANAGQWLSKPSVSSSYNVNINFPNKPLFCGLRIVYSICNSQVNSQANCRIFNTINPQSSDNQLVTIMGVKNNEVVFVQLQQNCALFTGNAAGGATYQIGYVPYGLREYDVLSGSPNPVNPNDCTDNRGDQASWTDRLLGSDSAKTPSRASKSVNEKTLQPEEVRWYVSGYLTSAAPSFALTYQGKSAWCRQTGTSAEIYRINTITLGSGTYKIASPDYSDFLGNVNCCPGEVSGNKVCQSDFTYKSIVDSTCGGFQACGSPNWVPSDATTIIKYSCDSSTGKCVSQTKKVECSNDAACNDANKLCDLNSHTCVKANVNLDGQVIKTVPDNIADCAAQGGTWKSTSTTSKTGTFCFFGQGLCQDNTIVNAYCDTNNFDWISLIILIIVILVVIVVLVFLFPIVRPMLKSIPYLGRIIP